MPGPKPRLNLPYDQWPPADRLLWQKSFCNDDPFGETVNAHLAKATLVHWLWAWRRFLGFLANHDPAALDIAPTERLTITRVRLFVGHLAETNAGQSVASTIDALYRATCITMPEQDWSWLRAIKARIYKSAPARAQSGPIITSVQLLELGLKLMDDNKPAHSTPISTHDAINYRDGLMAAFLAFIPIRPKNLAALEIGRHLVKEGDRWFVTIPREETKTRTAIDFPFPELLEPYLNFYLDVVRPRILRRGTCAALWVSPKCGGALSHVGISKSFNRLSKRLGRRISPHDARDAAATTWAISVPDQIGVARDLLAHTDVRTTIKHYNRARGIEASRTYSQVISGMRRKQNRHGS